MVKQVLLPIIAVMAFIILIGLYTQGKLNFLFPNGPVMPQSSTSNSAPIASNVVKINNKTINVEIANTEEAREQGLSDRPSLQENSGMLFVFNQKPVSARFWMKDMLIPLDMVWIAGNKIIKIDREVPPPQPGTPDNDLQVYGPDQQIDYVLEVNSGFCDKNNIKEGDTVILPF